MANNTRIPVKALPAVATPKAPSYPDLPREVHPEMARAHRVALDMIYDVQQATLNVPDVIQRGIQIVGGDTGNNSNPDDMGATINAAAAKGGMIRVAAGDYTLKTPIDLTQGKNIMLVGDGMGSTILRWSGDGPAVKLARASSGSLSGSGFIFVRDLSIAGNGQAKAGQFGFYANGTQDITCIEGVEVVDMGDDGYRVDSTTALTSIRHCYFHRNLQYAIAAVSNGVQNLVIENNEIFNNNGGINILGSAGITIKDNDIETGQQGTASLPMLNLQDVNVNSSGNTYGYGPAATGLKLCVINRNSFRSFGDEFAIGKNTQTAIEVGANASQAGFLFPVLAAPGGGGGTGFNILAGALHTYILNGSFYNLFTNDVIDAGTGTTNTNPGNF